MSFDNKQLKDATDFLWDLYASSVPENKMECDFSSEFLKKMETLQRKYRVQKMWKAAVRCAAMLLLILLLTGSVVLTLSPDAQAAFRTWVREISSSGALYRFFNEPKEINLSENEVVDEQALPVYNITELPQGFIFQRELKTTGSCVKVYKNENGEDTMCFMYTETGTHMVLGTNRQHQAQTTVNGMPADFYDDRDGSAADFIWIDEEANLVFCLSAFMDMEKMVEIAESVKQP